MGNSVEKRTIAQFVHDAVEMETAIYTLYRMSKECEKKKETIYQEAKDNLDEAENDLEISKYNLSDRKAYGVKTKPPTKENVGCGAIGCSGFLLGIAVAFVAFVIVFTVLSVLFNIDASKDSVVTPSNPSI